MFGAASYRKDRGECPQVVVDDNTPRPARSTISDHSLRDPEHTSKKKDKYSPWCIYSIPTKNPSMLPSDNLSCLGCLRQLEKLLHTL